MVKRLLYLNGVAILAVILFHASGMGFTAMFAWSARFLPASVPASSQIGSLQYYFLRIIEQISMCGLPAFLFLSGFFIAVAAGRNRPTVSWQVVRARIKYLLIPYFVWSLISLALLFLEGNRYSPVSILVMILTGKTSELLYFVPLLIQFYLLSPFIIRAAKKNWKALLLVTGILQFLVVAFSYPVFLGSDDPFLIGLNTLVPKWFFLARIFWFPFGVVVFTQLEEFKGWLSRVRWGMLVTTTLLIPLGVLEWETLFRMSGLAWLPARETFLDLIYAFTAICCLLAFDNAHSWWFDKVSWIGTKSYGIFLIHGIAITYTAKIIYHIAPNLLAYQLFLQPILIIAGLSIPLLMMAIVDKSPLRRFYTYLYG